MRLEKKYSKIGEFFNYTVFLIDNRLKASARNVKVWFDFT